MLIDNDNVLLLRSARPGSGFARGESPAAVLISGDGTAPVGPTAVPQAFVEFFERTLQPALLNAGSTLLATFVTRSLREHAFPNLPVREGEDVFVWFARFADRASYERYVAATQSARPQPLEVLLLSPTATSRVQ